MKWTERRDLRPYNHLAARTRTLRQGLDAARQTADYHDANARSEDGMVKLSDEVRAKVEAPNFWHLATLNQDGAPHVTPMWSTSRGIMSS